MGIKIFTIVKFDDWDKILLEIFTSVVQTFWLEGRVDIEHWQKFVDIKIFTNVKLDDSDKILLRDFYCKHFFWGWGSIEHWKKFVSIIFLRYASLEKG